MSDDNCDDQHDDKSFDDENVRPMRWQRLASELR
jgi:hypothetical protein